MSETKTLRQMLDDGDAAYTYPGEATIERLIPAADNVMDWVEMAIHSVERTIEPGETPESKTKRAVDLMLLAWTAVTPDWCEVWLTPLFKVAAASLVRWTIDFLNTTLGHKWVEHNWVDPLIDEEPAAA